VSVRRLSPLAEPAARLARELKRCEARVALLDRARPLNWASELTRLGAGFLAGHRPEPAFEPGPPAQLADVRRVLSEIARTLEPGDTEERLLSARALELELEAQLAEHVGQPAFSALAQRRFPLPVDIEAARRLAEALLASPTTDETTSLHHVSDDLRDPDSLWSKLSRRLAAERWPVRVELVPGLVSLAAVAEGVVRVRPGARLSARVAERIALHEVEGHVRPRVSGQQLGGAFMAGTQRASEDEEGRAILLEERAGLFDCERRKELARRYLAAASVRQGATLWETVDLLGRTGALAPPAIELACRVHRGGGLGRELIYLTGYARVKVALTARPELERVMLAGRISLDAAESLLSGSIELDDDRDVV
jgi:hypothetical protein